MLPLDDIQGAIYHALTLALAPIPVRDHVHRDQAYPYTTIGEMSATPDDALTARGNDIELTVHHWSRQPEMAEIQNMMQRAYSALHYKRFRMEGAQWVQTVYVIAQTLRDIDGVTRHGIMRFRVSVFTAG